MKGKKFFGSRNNLFNVYTNRGVWLAAALAPQASTTLFHNYTRQPILLKDGVLNTSTVQSASKC